MWAGLAANIPAGWALCNGLNGTPDLTDRFIKGGLVAGLTGGAATHTHAAHTGVIDHTHPVTDPGHAHAQNAPTSASGGTARFAVDTNANGSTPSLTTASEVTGVTTAAPVGAVASLTHDSPSHEPPFYALCFIQKL